MLKFYFDRVEFAVYMRVWRRLHELSIKEMGELTGLAYNTINGVERNENAPQMESFVILCSTMDADPKQFFKTSSSGD